MQILSAYGWFRSFARTPPLYWGRGATGRLGATPNAALLAAGASSSRRGSQHATSERAGACVTECGGSDVVPIARTDECPRGAADWGRGIE